MNMSQYMYFEPKSESEVAQSCLTLCDPIDCSIPGSSVHGIFQAIVLEWTAISFSSVQLSPVENFSKYPLLNQNYGDSIF